MADLPTGPGSTEENKQEFPLPATPDQIIDEHYNWKWSADTNKLLFRAGGALAAVSLGLAFLA